MVILELQALSFPSTCVVLSLLLPPFQAFVVWWRLLRQPKYLLSLYSIFNRANTPQLLSISFPSHLLHFSNTRRAVAAIGYNTDVRKTVQEVQWKGHLSSNHHLKGVTPVERCRVDLVVINSNESFKSHSMPVLIAIPFAAVSTFNLVR